MLRIFCFLVAVYIVLSKDCNPLEYGAKGDGKTDDTLSIQTMFNNCVSTTESIIITFPANYTFVTFPIKLMGSNTKIIFEKGTTLEASPNYKQWPISSDNIRYEPYFTTKYDISNIELTGNGIIFGNGQIWWPLYKNNELQYKRPHMFYLHRITNLTVSEITMINSPKFHLYLDGNMNVDVYNVNVTVTDPGFSNSPNTDGIDVGSQNVHVWNSYVNNGDDSFCLKPGGYNVLIENSTCENGIGIDIGTGGNMTNIVIKNMIAKNTEHGIRLKAKNNTQNGIQSNILFENITFINVQKGIDINEFNQSLNNNNNIDNVKWVDISNIIFKDIKGSYTEWPGMFNCYQGTPCRNLTFDNVQLSGVNKEWECSDYVYGTVNNVSPPLTCLQH